MYFKLNSGAEITKYKWLNVRRCSEDNFHLRNAFQEREGKFWWQKKMQGYVIKYPTVMSIVKSCTSRHMLPSMETHQYLPTHRPPTSQVACFRKRKWRSEHLFPHLTLRTWRGSKRRIAVHHPRLLLPTHLHPCSLRLKYGCVDLYTGRWKPNLSNYVLMTRKGGVRESHRRNLLTAGDEAKWSHHMAITLVRRIMQVVVGEY